MKDFVSFTIKDNHPPFNIFSTETDLLVQTRNVLVLATETFKNINVITQNVFANILISMLSENLSLDNQSGFQLNPR